MGTGNHGDDLYKCINWLLNIYRLRTASECARVLLFVTEQYRRDVPGLLEQCDRVLKTPLNGQLYVR